MAVKLNGAADSNARNLIKAGKVDKTSDWSISADEENEILGNDDWAEYSKWHLGVDDAEDEKTKAHYKYPIGKSGRVYRSALIAIRQRAGQQDATDIFDAAGKLVDMIDDDGKENDNDGDEGGASSHRLELMASPWALMPECLAAVANPKLAKQAAFARPSRPAAGARSGAIAVIQLTGVLTQKGSWYSYGDTSLDQFCADFSAALADDTVGAILIDVDSPGGSVYGTAETAALVASANKPVVAIANSLAASAAYWIACAADEFYVTPGGEVGSIGVWQAHMDYSQMLSDAGLNVTLISAGKYKVEGNPYQPLDEDAKSFMQSRVDDYYGAFTKAVSKGRNVPIDTVRNGMGQGRVLGADQAAKEGMVDGVATRADVIKGMQKKMRDQSAKSASSIDHARMALSLK